MSAKGKAKGKAFLGPHGVVNNSTKQHEGAIDNNFFIKAQMKDGTWLKSRIIECRLSKGFQYHLSKDYDPKTIKTEYSYEYYIHYEGQNRRMDEWVTRNRIEVTQEEITEEPVIKKRNKKEEKKEYVENDEHEGMDAVGLLAHEMHTKVKTIDSIEFGNYRCETWYYSPYPSGYHNLDCLYICEFCLSFYVLKSERERHLKNCELAKLGHPPGDEIYRDTQRQISMFEIDGHRNPIYCENLCYLAKLFLDHKNLYYDVEPFLFFVLCEYNETGFHLVGYFSKEKESTHGWNLSCILTLPFQQRKGYGKFLISMSYQLSLIEGKIGTPERPLSDLGRESYLSWWTQTLIEYFRKFKGTDISLNSITKETGMKDSDILWTLEQKQLIKYQSAQPLICMDMDYLDKVYVQAGRPGIPINKDNIHWVPYKKLKNINEKN
ncbi:hypothetical protein pb186bvf_003731 [Paramecium bursaria]